MKNYKITILFVALLACASLAFGQTATTSTTLSAAVSDSSTRVISLTSATNVNAPTTAHAGTQLYVDREQMTVTAVSGTLASVVRGTGGTVAMPHLSGATVYVDYPTQGNFGAFLARSKAGACTATSESYLPQLAINPPYGGNGGLIQDCFASGWYYDLNLPLYKLTLAPGAQRSGATPVTGATTSLTAQAGGASTAAGTAGANGGPMTVSSGAGGAGASTGTAGNGGTLTLSSGTGGAAAGAAATGGNGGTVAITAGASGGSITSGNGGSVNVTAGASANGSSAAGNGGNVNLQAGAVGTGGTGAAGKVQIKDATAPTKIAAFDVSAITAGQTRSVAVPDVNVTIIPVMNHSATAVNASTLHIVRDTCTLGTSCVVTLAGAAAFADTNYSCAATDATSAAAVKIVNTAAGTVTITGTGTDVINYVCVGI